MKRLLLEGLLKKQDNNTDKVIIIKKSWRWQEFLGPDKSEPR